VRVLVTGASGFLGGHLATLLVRSGHIVRALVRPTSDRTVLDPLGVETVTGAVDDRPSLEAAFEGVDAVVHAAGLTMALSREDYERVNVAGTKNVLDAAQTSGARLKRFVHVSSLAVVGPSDGPWAPPADRPLEPRSTYGRTKAAGEALALGRAPALPVTVIRPPVVYGPRDREFLRVFRSASIGVVPYFAGKGAVSLVHAEDCAAAIVAILEKEHPAGRIYPVDDGPPHTPKEIAVAVSRALGKRTLRIPVPRAVVWPVAAVSGAVAAVRRRPVLLTLDKAPEIIAPFQVSGHDAIGFDLDWKPAIGIEEGFRRTAEWYRTHGWI
jgi:nucleoside-diphosphate-sugar epimerase